MRLCACVYVLCVRVVCSLHARNLVVKVNLLASDTSPETEDLPLHRICVLCVCMRVCCFRFMSDVSPESTEYTCMRIRA